jgi:hypothetical protein
VQFIQNNFLLDYIPFLKFRKFFYSKRAVEEGMEIVYCSNVYAAVGYSETQE